MQYLTAEGRKAYRRGNFNLYEDRPAPDDPEQLELKRRYTQEREGDTWPEFYHVARAICAYYGQEFASGRACIMGGSHGNIVVRAAGMTRTWTGAGRDTTRP